MLCFFNDLGRSKIFFCARGISEVSSKPGGSIIPRKNPECNQEKNILRVAKKCLKINEDCVDQDKGK